MMRAVEVRRRTPQGKILEDETLPAILRHIYACRGIQDRDELGLGAQQLVHFKQLTDCEKAAARIGQAILNRECICICGDFDADGATSVTLLMDALAQCGAQRLFYLVPNRFTDGYGLSPGLVELAAHDGANLIITVDNGISSHAGIQRANELGVEVIVTDHHLPSAELPNAHSIVNPNRRDCPFPSKQLAGVGVAFYVLLALRAWFRAHEASHPAASINVAQWLDLVAVGTVADVVPLDQNNRILVQQGLARIRQRQCRPGILALLEVAGREPEALQAQDLGFTVGPRINAAGRLDDIQLGIECLRAKTLEQAKMMALRLDELNRERRSIEHGMQQDAERFLASFQVEQDTLPPVLAVHQADWHQGVIGILAGRLKEQLHRPVMVFAQGDAGLLKGSCRSVPGVHIRDLLEQVASRAPECIERFGGHAMAAGLSVPQTQWGRFCEVLQDVAMTWVSPDVLHQVIWTDGALEGKYLNVDTAKILQNAGPFGQGFPAPTFDGHFRVLDARWLKETHLKFRLQPAGTSRVIDGIAFFANRAPWEWREQTEVHIVYRLEVNEFRGQQSAQLLIESLR